jgi:hypothetical protein
MDRTEGNVYRILLGKHEKKETVWETWVQMGG